jgi:hypothetical protein
MVLQSLFLCPFYDDDDGLNPVTDTSLPASAEDAKLHCTISLAMKILLTNLLSICLTIVNIEVLSISALLTSIRPYHC